MKKSVKTMQISNFNDNNFNQSDSNKFFRELDMKPWFSD